MPDRHSIRMDITWGKRDPLGLFLYVVNNSTVGCKSCDSVSGFNIQAAGPLKLLSSSPFPIKVGGAIPQTLLVPDHTGNVLYAAAADGIDSYSIDGTSGSLSLLISGTGFGNSGIGASLLWF